MSTKIFLYEPDEHIGHTLKSALEKQGYDVDWMKFHRSAANHISQPQYNISIIDIDGTDDNDDPARSGIDLIKAWFGRGNNPLCVSIYTDQDTVAGFTASQLGSQAIYEIQHGDGNVDALNRILRKYNITATMPQLFEHTSEEFNKCIHELQQLINHNMPVLITGERGSGKSYLAEHIHKEGTDGDFKLEEIKCGDIDKETGKEDLFGIVRNARPDVRQDRKGLIDYANDRGLLYLEQIQNLPQELQEPIADMLESGEYWPVGAKTPKKFTAKFVASCNTIEDIRHDDFDHKLYVLISHNIVTVPPLRHCPKDIIKNAEQIIDDFCRLKGIADKPKLKQDAMIQIFTHKWTGNYRELKRCIESAVSRCSTGEISADDLNLTLDENEKDLPSERRSLLIHLLEKHNGKKKAIMDEMGISAPTLDKYLKEENLDAKLFKAAARSKDRVSRSFMR